MKPAPEDVIDGYLRPIRIGFMVLGTIQILLGLGIWGENDKLVPLHVVVGVCLVLMLWICAWLAYQSMALRPQALPAFVLGLVAILYGGAQVQILTGSAHWVVQVIHLVIGLAVIGFGQSLAARLSRASSTREPAPAA